MTSVQTNEKWYYCMMNLILKGLAGLVFFALFFSLKVHAQETSFTSISYEVKAQFPGGQDSMYAFIVNNLVYPSEAISKNIEGKVLLEFVINENGEISDAKVLKGVHPLLDEAALIMLSKMPRWEPALFNDKPVKVRYRLPVQFKL